MLKLTDEARGRLLGLQRGMGYQDFLDIGEKLCQIAETDLLRMDRAKGFTAEQILSAQEQCRAQRVFFERWQMEIEEQVNALVDNQAAQPRHKTSADDTPLVLEVAEAADILGLIPETESQI